LLLVRLRRDSVFAAGRLPARRYPAGWYLYAGSALRGLRSRLVRYLDPARKRHWHVDYLLDHGEANAAWVITGRDPWECRLAAALAARLELVPRFGASDCRCSGHLLYAARRRELLAAVRGLADSPFSVI
jgi:Uri superfamily endonuclease